METIYKILEVVVPLGIFYYAAYRIFCWIHDKGYKTAVKTAAKIKQDIEDEMRK